MRPNSNLAANFAFYLSCVDCISVGPACPAWRFRNFPPPAAGRARRSARAAPATEPTLSTQTAAATKPQNFFAPPSANEHVSSHDGARGATRPTSRGQTNDLGVKLSAEIFLIWLSCAWSFSPLLTRVGRVSPRAPRLPTEPNSSTQTAACKPTRKISSPRHLQMNTSRPLVGARGATRPTNMDSTSSKKV